ncbi:MULTISPECIES: hypothetical protein [Pedobacter]|uniref:T9SS C-terminal target domain-containing protein n=1 Tax=Pedobacter heparinus (strain ATCC 13125 / DSM 2366 / CIP 104194 / JCM 7457 / NBRC 12017 / NCIMB 9290 / NRRL B-14731 / HIM 762-3) TaxID=485917 RepID=C6Y260_PEDHD|nr:MULTISPECIES: hypothetical protein [Pedobacter]ACU03053.1 conserved hypothetical protein [Pedobacter heparinus DSM 2366]MBB5438432.1 hypothetical protein [Pedobacter sp. AK017]
MSDLHLINSFVYNKLKHIKMKKQLLASIFGLLVFLTSCSKSTDDDGDINPPATGTVEVSGDITTSTTWSADKIYLLKGNVFVTNNATLTIEPGTIIKGDKGTKGALIITRGAKIMAVGTVEKPIVFTSSITAGARKEGDWGGVILLGKAQNNLGTSVPIEGISDATDKGKHGGTDNTDNSGIMKYVRIEFAGIALSPDNEINGLTFGSVGSGTTIDYIEVYRSGDDAYEWFGGAVNCSHLLAIDSWDDDFDTDNGFSGKVQFGLAQRLAVTADVSGSNGFESDNNAAGDNATPQTSAVFSNMTILGPVASGGSSINANFQHGAQIRRNSAMSLFNSVIVGYTEGVFYDDGLPTTPVGGVLLNSSLNLTAGRSVFANNLVYNSNSKNNQIKASNATALGVITPLLTVANTFDASATAESIFISPYKYSADLVAAARVGTPDFTVKTGSAAASGAAFTNAKLASGFTSVAYRGAFGTDNWAAGWAHFDPQSLPYTTPGAVK